MYQNNLVTILMPVYNGETYLKESIESILNQSFTNFDFLIIDDGSTDQTENIINSYNDNRIKYLKNDSNLGIVKTLNKGLSYIKTKYIVRMDSDDVCFPDRLKKEISYMEKNQDVAVLGCSADIINKRGEKKGSWSFKFPDNHANTYLLFGNCMIHSSIVMRNDILKREKFSYDILHNAVEDYGLWLKVSKNYWVDLLPEKLLKYRINPNGITSRANEDHHQRICAHIDVYRDYFNEICSDEISDNSLLAYYQFIHSSLRREDIELLAHFLKVLTPNISAQKKISNKVFLKLLSNTYRSNCVAMKISYQKMLNIYHQYFKEIFSMDATDKLKYFMNTLQIKKRDI